MKNKSYLLSFFLLFACFCLVAQTNVSSRYAAKSVLAEGDWYKIKVGETGVYKLTYEALRSMGLSDPKNVQVYGYGGWVLEQDFSGSYLEDYDDLPQVAVWMNTPRESFGPGDYILFYAKGNIKWEYDRSRDEFVHTQNPYSSDAYYFITESPAGPKIIEMASVTSAGTTVINEYTDYYLHEQELTNIAESGREFYGENFRGRNSQDFRDIVFQGITSPEGTLTFDFIARPLAGSARVALSMNNTQLISESISMVSTSNNYYLKARNIHKKVQVENLAQSNTVAIAYTPSATTDENVHLNYFRINYNRTLQPYGAVTLFRSKVADANVQFQVAQASERILIFDVTNGETPRRMSTSVSGNVLSFRADNGEMREYAMVDISRTIPEPELVGKVANQNLHGLEAKEMIIIVRPLLRQYAEELAAIHLEDSGLECLIVEAEDIYNEFSSGKPDVTAYRRFAKMFYDRGQDESSRPQYLLLFGDGTYDNRFINSTSSWTEIEKRSMLLTYQSEESLHEGISSGTGSTVMEDYIGFLDDGEARNDDAMKSAKLDIAIGRLPIRNDSEASDMVNKIRTYIENKGKGIWKNNIGLVADDLISANKLSTGERYHVQYSENYARTLEKNYPHFMVNRLYADAYERVITSSGGAYPTVTQLIQDKLNSGLLVMNYVGHGSTYGWAHENLITVQDIKKLTNSNWPLIITATCDFGRFDADETSAGEMFLLNPKGGAIAMFTTVRVVYGSSNNTLNTAIFNHIFEKKNDKPIRIGDILRNAKSRIDDNNQLRFSLLGDPALRLSYPDDTYNIEITRVHETIPGEGEIWLKALASTTVRGRIIDTNGNPVNSFNGVLESVVFDSQQNLSTRGNTPNGETDPSPEYVYEYTDYTNTIYFGKVNVVNGEFNIEFTVPKDILYSDDYGKMSFYAYDDTNGYEAKGSFLDYIVGGMDENAKEDNTPPEIREIYLNRADFQSGDQVNTTPVFYASVSDDTGINISSGIGHEMHLIVDETDYYNLTPYFVKDEDEENAGSVQYVLPELKRGSHTLQFKVFDVWNNSATGRLDFVVTDNYKPAIYDLVLKGNPAKDKVTFEVLSDVTGSEVDIKYEVYSFTGALQWQLDMPGTSELEYEWDLTTSGGRRLEAGIYICRVQVSVDGGPVASKSEKLIILEQ